MRFPQKVMNLLKHKKLKHPTPIQMQGFPSALMGRDIIAKAPTGTGKTLVFLLSALLICYEEELKMPTIKGEGPFVIILLPSRELAIQIHNIATE
jgi:ATP-dependent RNA helicase DDX41